MSKGTTYIAIRDFEGVSGRLHKAGETVDISGWPFRRAELLVTQRFLRVATPSHRRYIVVKPLEIGAITLSPGSVLDHVKHAKDFPQTKLEQLVERRWLTIDDSAPAVASPAASPKSPASTSVTIPSGTPALADSRMAPTSAKAGDGKGVAA